MRETFLSSSIETFEDIDWQLPPPDRGFWTDEEMFELTGAGSLLLVRELTGAKLTVFSKYRKPNGRLARAWSEKDIYLAALVLDFTRVSGFNQRAVIEILRHIPRELVDRHLDIDGMIEEVTDVYIQQTSSKGKPISDSEDRVFGVHRHDSLSIEVIDRRYVMILTDHEREGLVTERTPLGELINLDTKKPSLKPFFENNTDYTVTTHPGSEMTVHLCRLGLSFLLKRFQLDFQPDFTPMKRETRER